MRRLCHERGIPLVDWAGAVPEQASDLFEDDVHLTGEGNVIVAALPAERVAALLAGSGRAGTAKAQQAAP